jgi:thiol-disulfide isomerase/thioredoxin
MRRGLFAGAVCAAVIAAVIGGYVFGVRPLMEPTIHTVTAPATVSATVSLTSDPKSFAFWDKPRALPGLSFSDENGRTLSLSDFHGRPVLLNIWATWCVPCREEMPALDRLQAQLKDAGLVVLPLSIDRQGTAVVKPFYQELGLTSLGIYVDSTGASFRLNAPGIPTTLFVDREGREIGRKVGAAEWDSQEIVSSIRQRFALAADPKDNVP